MPSGNGSEKKDSSYELDGWWGFDNTSYGDYGHDVQPASEVTKPSRGCICGQDSVSREEDRADLFHSRWCPVYKESR